jgi:dTDP-4-dehydrorhamnose reductase
MALIIRTSWVYSVYGNNFVKTMMKLMKEKTSINVVDDQIGSPTYAADLAECIMKIISYPDWHPGIYNFSNQGTVSWFEFAKEIKRLLGSSCLVNPIPTSAYPTPAKRPSFSVMNKDKICSTYHIHLKPWQESLQQCMLLLQE